MQLMLASNCITPRSLVLQIVFNAVYVLRVEIISFHFESVHIALTGSHVAYGAICLEREHTHTHPLFMTQIKKFPSTRVCIYVVEIPS